MQPLRPQRPTGITIIAILSILIGVLGLLGGVAIIGFSALLSASTLAGANSAFLTGFGLILGGIVVVFSLIWLAVGVGFLHGKSWAWTLGMIFSVLSIIGAASLVAVGGYSGIVGVLVWGMTIYYLTRNRVKSFFGKGPQALAPQAFTPTPAFSSPAFASPTMRTPPGTTSTFNTQTSQGATASLNRFCTQCGATITPGSTKCGSCGKDL
jgi:hypothetical protein